jgi:hypothetical protein
MHNRTVALHRAVAQNHERCPPPTLIATHTRVRPPQLQLDMEGRLADRPPSCAFEPFVGTPASTIYYLLRRARVHSVASFLVVHFLMEPSLFRSTSHPSTVRSWRLGDASSAHPCARWPASVRWLLEGEERLLDFSIHVVFVFCVKIVRMLVRPHRA